MLPRERLVRRFVGFTNEYPWHWLPGHVDEWTQSLMAESHLAASTIRGYQGIVKLFVWCGAARIGRCDDV
jgi:hypothetical protein